MTLTFELYVVLIGQGRRSHHKRSEVSITNSKKVILSKFRYFQRQLMIKERLGPFGINELTEGASE